MSTFEALIAEWDGMGVVTGYDRETDSWMFVALHDATLGRPTGGCRMRTYETPADGLKDAMRLAEGMTYKWAAMDLGFGGGKSVLAVPRPLEGEARRHLFRRFGALMNALNGAYGVGEDLGTTPEDMAFLSTITPYVAGAERGGDPVDPGPYTAVGVFEGIKAAVAHLDGGSGMDGISVLVQGVGDVGLPLARLVKAAGGVVLVSDIDEEKAAAVARELGGTVVALGDVYDTECDVYAPCAVGATVNPTTTARLRCRIVAGSANNQLEAPEDAARLRERGILYAPDYVINGGGAMAFGLMDQGILDPDELTARVRSIGTSLSQIFEEADKEGSSPLDAARGRALHALEGRGTRGT